MKRKTGIIVLFITTLICMYYLPLYCYNIFNLVGCNFTGGKITWFYHDIDKCDTYDFSDNFDLSLGSIVPKETKSRKYTFICDKLNYDIHMIKCTLKGKTYLVGYKKNLGEIVYIEPVDEDFMLYGKVKKWDLKSKIDVDYNIYEMDFFTQIAYGFPENWGCILWFNTERRWVIRNFYQTNLELPPAYCNHTWNWLTQKIYFIAVFVPYYIFYPTLLSFIYLIFSSFNKKFCRKKVDLAAFGIIFIFIITAITYITMYEYYYGSI